jgi:predicted nucleic acid-binding protein
VAKSTPRLPISRLSRHSAEVEEKLAVKFGFSPRHARVMTLFVERQIQLVEVSSTITACVDRDDNRILAATIDAGCSHLITGDSDLLRLNPFQGITILTPRQFLETALAPQ